MKAFASRLRQLREVRGLSQRELADLLRVEVMQVSRYERRMNVPSAETVVRLAQVLQVTTDELLRGPIGSSEPPEFKDVRLLERLRQLDEAPKDAREVAIEVLDAIIAKHRIREVVAR